MPRSLGALAGALSIVVCCAAPAFAAGPVIITQDSAVAGGITPTDAPGFPVTIDLPGTYQLGSSIQVTGGIAFDIKSGVVTLDLNGYEIDGHSTGSIGIQASGAQLRVMNGTVLRFKNSGITWVSAAASLREGWTIDNMTLTGNGRAGVRCGGSCMVLNSNVYRNGFGTGSNPYSAIVLDTGMVLGSTIINNALYGIQATVCAGYAHDFLYRNGVAQGIDQVNDNVRTMFPNFEANACQPPA